MRTQTWRSPATFPTWSMNNTEPGRPWKVAPWAMMRLPLLSTAVADKSSPGAKDDWGVIDVGNWLPPAGCTESIPSWAKPRSSGSALAGERALVTVETSREPGPGPLGGMGSQLEADEKRTPATSRRTAGRSCRPEHPANQMDHASASSAYPPDDRLVHLRVRGTFDERLVLRSILARTVVHCRVRRRVLVVTSRCSLSIRWQFVKVGSNDDTATLQISAGSFSNGSPATRV